MTTIIIEDEKPAARLLNRKLEKINIKAHKMLHSVAEATEWFRTNPHPDLIFLDIQLSDGLSFEIFDAMSINSAVIFTTAYDEYALRAFKLNSIDYLLKPIDEDDLEIAVNKFKKRIANLKGAPIDFEQIKQLLLYPDHRKYKSRFTVKIGMQLKVIALQEIECFFSENKGTYIHTKDNRDYLIDGTMEQLEQDLDPKNHFRVNRKLIACLDSLKEIQFYSNSRLKLILPSYSAEDIIVSREKVSDFKTWIG